MNTTAQSVTTGQLKRWLLTAPKNPKLLLITPELAYEALIHNDENFQRPLTPGTVKEYARRMREKAWPLVPDPISFDVKGRTQNGQHRLHAVVESGVPIPAWCFFGQPEDNFAFYDIGRKRTPSDIFSIRGVRNAKNASTIARKVWKYNQKTGLPHPVTAEKAPMLRTPTEAYDYYLALGPESVQDSVCHYKRCQKQKLSAPGTVAAMHFIAKGLDAELAEEFFVSLATGANLGPRSIVKKLRDHLLRSSGSIRAEFVGELVIRAWNAKRTGRRTFDLQPNNISSAYPTMV